MSNSSDNHIYIEQILKMIPHRYPFLLIDKVTCLVPDEYALGVKNVTFNEPQFLGHFPGKPIMPGVLIVEAMAQTSAVLVVHTLGEKAENKLVYFMSITEAKFRKIVVPGDTMHIHVTKNKNRGKVWVFEAQAMVENSIVAEAQFSAMIMDRE